MRKTIEVAEQWSLVMPFTSLKTESKELVQAE